MISFVGECLSSTDGVVTERAESVFYKQIDNHIAVASVTCHVRVEVSACGCVAVVTVSECLSGANGVVAFCMEGIFHKKAYHNITVAVAGGKVPEYKSLRCGVLYSFVGKNLSGADGVVAEGAESVFNKQIYNYIAVAASSGRVPENKNFRRGVRNTFVVEGLSCADGVVTQGAECVSYKQI